MYWSIYKHNAQVQIYDPAALNKNLYSNNTTTIITTTTAMISLQLVKLQQDYFYFL